MSSNPEQRLDLAKRLWAWEPHPGQREFLTMRQEDGSEPGVLVAACGRRWGKTNALAVDVACRLLLEPDLAQLLVGPTRDQAEGLFDEVVSLIEDLQEEEACVSEFPHLSQLVIQRSPYSQIRKKVKGSPQVLSARSAGRNGRNLRGKGTTRKVRKFRVVCDEAAYIPDSAIQDAILPMLATIPGGGQLVMISSPAGRRGLFYKSYGRGERREGRYRAVRLPSSQNPMVDETYLAEMREDMTDRRFRAEFLAEFVESEGAVFRQDEIEAAILEDDPEREPLPKALYVAGVDFGRRGDYTVVAVARVDPWQVSVVDLVRVRGLAWAEQIGMVADTLGRWGVRNVTVDRSGIGDVAAEGLQDAIIARRLRCVMDEFIFTQVTKKQLVDALSLLLSGRRIQYPAYPDMIRELQLFEVVNVSVTGHERMAASEGHDDIVMALGLCVQAAAPYLTIQGLARTVGATGGQRSQGRIMASGRSAKDAEFSGEVVAECLTKSAPGGMGYAEIVATLALLLQLRLLLPLTSVYRSGAVRGWVASLRRTMARKRESTRPEG